MKRHKIAIACFCLSLCRCAIPSAPPPAPPLPAAKAVTVPLTTSEQSILGQMDQWDDWMISLGEMAKTHSNQPVLLNYAAKIVDNSHKHKDTIKVLLKNHAVQLKNANDPHKQKELALMGKLYGKKFDYRFLQIVNKENINRFNNLINKESGKVISKDLTLILNKFSENIKTYRNQARDILRSEGPWGGF